MLVYYFVPFIVSNRYLLFWVSNGHNSVTVQNRIHVYMNFFHHKDLGNHLLQLCPKVVKHPVFLTKLVCVCFCVCVCVCVCVCCNSRYIFSTLSPFTPLSLPSIPAFRRTFRGGLNLFRGTSIHSWGRAIQRCYQNFKFAFKTPRSVASCKLPQHWPVCLADMLLSP